MKLFVRISAGFFTIVFFLAQLPAQQPELVVQTGHALPIESIALSPNGRVLASGSQDRNIALWDLASGRQLRLLTGHTDIVQSVAFSPDGHTLASASRDKTVRLWDAATGRELRTLSEHKDSVEAIAFSPVSPLLASAGNDKVIKLWDVPSGQEVRSFTGHTDIVDAVAFSRDGKMLASASWDGTIRIWDVRTGLEIHVINNNANGEHNALGSIAFAPDGKSLASSGAECQGSGLARACAGIVKLWDIATGNRTLTIHAHRYQHSGGGNLIFSPDGHTLATAGDECEGPMLSQACRNVIKLFDTATGAELQSLEASNEPVKSLAYGPDGRSLVSGYNSIRIWDTIKGRILKTLSGHTGWIRSVVCSPDGKTLATGRNEGAIKLWDLAGGQALRMLAGHSNVVDDLTFSPDSKTLVSAGWDNAVKLWDVASASALRGAESVRYFNFGASSAVLSPDGKILAAYWNETVKLWEMGSGRELRTLGLESSADPPLAFSPKGQILASGSYDGTLKLWDITSGQELASLPAKVGRNSWVTFSPDGTILASADEDRTIKLWDVASRREKRTIAEHTAWINFLQFSPDGHTLMSQSAEDQTIRLWDLVSNKQLRTFQPSEVAAFCRDGRLIASADPNGKTRLLDAATGKDVATLFAMDQTGWAVGDPDGRFDVPDLDRVEGVSWVFPDDPLRALPPEIFMRDYYEPRLLQRLMAGDELPRVRPLQDLNRVQPIVKIVSVRRGASADLADVTVEVSHGEGSFQRGTKTVTMKTDVYDLRLFRSGHLVAQEPKPLAEAGKNMSDAGLSGEQLQAWRDARRIRLDAASGSARRTFTVRLPRGQAGKSIEFTAYAFNEDRVKSETIQATYRIPQDVPIRKAKAYVITIGVNGYENPHRNLEFAVKDAEDMAFAVGQIKEYEVVPVSLLSKAPKAGAAMPVSQATKAKIRAVLGILAGSSDHTALSGVADADKLVRATPDDLVILSFSGHGHTEPGGAFYLLPSDSGKEDAVTPASLKKFISSEELSEWLRQVDAGQMAMIIDACHSAASVETPGFKPGPMGDRGLGQLAYDKGMRILAASQADDVSLEIQNLQQGLLTYALVWDGLRAGEGGKLRADLNGDGKITLEEWLKYGEQRVPSLYEDAKAGKVKMVSRDSRVISLFIDETARRAQTPSLFDFHKQNDDVVLQSR